MKLVYLPFLLIIVIGLTACSYGVQTSSGGEYLTRYASEPAAATAVGDVVNFKHSLVKAAAKEPTLRFPARFGLARIESGRLSSVPAAEAKIWQEMTKRLGPGWGEFVAVSPLVSSLASAESRANGCEHCAEAVAQIRLGAAMQHLDAVLIYEVNQWGRDQSNFLSVANLTILGGFMLPTTTASATVTVNAILIDVLQGYPYGHAKVSHQDESLTTTWGSDSTREGLRENTRTIAVKRLSEDVQEMLRKLRLQLAEQRSG